jgi:hypothetical protein
MVFKKYTKKYFKVKKKYFLKNTRLYFIKKRNFFNPKFKKLLNCPTNYYILSIKITPNNIFCVLKKNIDNKTVFLISAGLLKIKVSKKKLKFSSKLILQKVFKNVASIIQVKSVLLLRFSGPKNLRKRLILRALKAFSKNRIILSLNNNKSFNGCRAKKLRRKKRKGFRVFK